MTFPPAIPPAARRLLLGATCLAIWAGGVTGQTGEGVHDGGELLTVVPAVPVQGHLFTVRVEAAGAGNGASEARRLVAVQGSVAGEDLHFHEVEPGRFQAPAPVPIDTEGEVVLALRFRYADGGEVSQRSTVPIQEGAYRHERLEVAPRYGSPPSEADQARRARDAAKARAVSEASHRTPRLWGGEARIPREDRVTSEFGNGRVFNGQVSSRHLGLDLDGDPGDTVYAPARGVVELVDDFLLAGNIVYLNHGAGLVSGYFHLSEQLVAPGDTVVAGTPIGRVGATGRVTGPHLHWVVRYGYQSVDPRSFLDIVRGGTRRSP